MGGKGHNGVKRQWKCPNEEKKPPQLSVHTHFHAWTSFM